MYVAGLDDAVSAKDFGFKAASLSGLRKTVPVPAGFVVTTDALEAFLSAGRLREKAAALFSKSALSTMEDVRRAESDVRSAFLSAAMPEDVRNAVMKSYEEFSVSDDVKRAGMAFSMIKAGRVHEMVAVRPSVIREAPDTFAGVMDSFINVSGEEDVLRCVKLCWASLFYPRALAYVEKKGIKDVSMSVIVQRMAPSEKGGMIMTGFGGGSVLIEASWGSGRAVSSGIVTPDEYLLDADGKIAGKNISKKMWMYERNEYTGLTSKVYVPAGKMNAQVLSDAEICKLFELSSRIGGGREQRIIDWAIGRNRVMITDAKPEKYEMDRNAGGGEGDVAVTGRFVSRGNAAGKVRRVDPFSTLPKDGDVVVLESSDAGIIALAAGASAVVADEGGRLCNMGILSREFSVPVISATHNARSVLKDGQDVKILADAGKVMVPVALQAQAEGTGVPIFQGFDEWKGGLTDAAKPPGQEIFAVPGEAEKSPPETGGGSDASGRPTIVFVHSALETMGGGGGKDADGFIIHGAAGSHGIEGPPSTEGVGFGVPVWVSCAGDQDFQWASSVAAKLSERGGQETGILVPVVRGGSDIEKFRYSMPFGARLGVNVRTPAVALSPDSVAVDGVSMANVDVDMLMQLSTGLQRPDHHIHQSVLEMIRRVKDMCTPKGIFCCATIGAQYLTDWNVESLVKMGVDAICVEPAAAGKTKGVLLRMGKAAVKPAKPQEVELTEENDASGEQKVDMLSLLGGGPSFS